MSERKVLVISYYFPPMGLSGVQRTLKFVKYLPSFGWQPLVLTTSSASFYAFDETLSRELPKDDITIYRTDDGRQKTADSIIKIKKFPSYMYQKLGSAVLQTFCQPDSRRSWLKHALKKGTEIIENNNIEVIYATAPPFTDFMVAKELSVKFNIPFIIDYRDVWVDNPFNFYATPFHKLYSIGLETEILDHAAKAIVTTRKTKELLLKRYKFLSHSDIDIISHGFDPADFHNYEHIKPDRSKFTITHSGLFQDNRTPKYFLKAVADFFAKNPEAKEVTQLRFVGIMRKNHLKYIKKNALSRNTVLTGYVNHGEVIKHLKESDVLWFMLNDTVRSPGKFYEYIGVKKPILACVPEGVISSQVREAGASAYVTPPKDVKSMTNALIDLFDKWKSGKMPVPDDNYVARFDRKTLSGELARVIELTSDIEKEI